MTASAGERPTGGSRLRFLRVGDWIHFLPVVLLPLASGNVPPLALVLGGLSAAGCLAYAFAWNSIHDEGLDAFPGLSPAEARLWLALSVALAGVPALAVGPAAAGAATVSLAGSWAYSGGPRLKRFPGIGTLANAPIFVPLALLACGDWPRDPPVLLLLAAYGLLLLQNQLIHEAQHAEEDRRDGLRTTAGTLGPRSSALAAGTLGLLAAGALAAVGTVRAPAWAFAALSTPAAGLSLRLALAPGLEAPTAATRLRLLQRWLGFGTGAAAWLVLVLA